MKTKQEFDIPQHCSLMYPLEEYEYIKVHFIIIEEDDLKFVIPVGDEMLSRYDDSLKSCYFIYFPMNWFNKHNVRIKSDHSSGRWGMTEVFEEFSYDLYKKNIIDQMLVAAIDENRNLISLDDETDKERINFNLINYSVEKLVQLNIKKRPYQIDMDALSKDAYLYNKFNVDKGAGKHVGAIMPKPPAAMILKNLADKYPHRAPEELMFMDDTILEMFEVLDTQETIKRHEAQTVHEDVKRTHANRVLESQGKTSKVPGFGVDKHSVNQPSKPMDRKQLAKRLGAKLEDVGNFRKS